VTEYSKRAQELARQLGIKAANNLRRAGYTVEQDKTGRYTFTRPTETLDAKIDHPNKN